MAERPPRAIRFIRAEVQSPAPDRCRAVVQIEQPEVGLFTGTADGGPADTDALRAVARATADAVTAALGSSVTIRVRGVQAVEAFAQTVVIVSVAGSREGKPRGLLGICEGGNDLRRAAALGVLNATNRFIGSG